MANDWRIPLVLIRKKDCRSIAKSSWKLEDLPAPLRASNKVLQGIKKGIYKKGLFRLKSNCGFTIIITLIALK